MLICCPHAKRWETICPLPFRHLLVQIQQMKHQNNVWNQFLIIDKGIRLTLLMSFWCFHCQFWASKSQLDRFPHRPKSVVETGINLSVWSPLRTVNETYGRCLIFTAFDYVFCTTSKSSYFTNTMISLHVSNFRILVSGIRNGNKNKRKISHKLQYHCIYWIQKHLWFCYTNEQFIEYK